MMRQPRPPSGASIRAGFLGDVAKLTVGNAVGQGILLLSAPVLTRLFDQTSVGVWQVFVSLTLLLSFVAGWRYELAVVLPREDREAANVVLLGASATAVTALVGLGLVFIGRTWIVGLVEASAQPDVVYLIPVLVLATGFRQVGTYWAIRHRRFSLLGVTSAVQPIVVATTQIGLGIAGHARAVDLVMGVVAGELAATVLLVGYLLRVDELFRRQRPALRELVAVARTYRNFPLFVAPFSFLANVNRRLIVVILATVSSTAIAGLYGIAFRLVMVPVMIVAGAINWVFYQSAAAAEPREVERLAGSLLVRLGLLAVPGIAIVSLLGADLIAFVLGPDWRQAGVFASYLAFPALLYLGSSWLDRLYDIHGRQRLALVLEVGYGATSLSALAVVFDRTQSAQSAVAAYAAVTAVYTLVWLVITWRVGRLDLAVLIDVGRVVGVPAVLWYAYVAGVRFSSEPPLTTVLVVVALVLYAGWLLQQRARFFAAEI